MTQLIPENADTRPLSHEQRRNEVFLKKETNVLKNSLKGWSLVIATQTTFG